jgi:two-component system OmpR family sensor kinase
MLTIKSKIILAYTIVFGALLIIFSVVVYHSTRQANFNKFDDRLKNYTMIIQKEVQEQIEENEDLDLEELQNIPAEGLIDVNIRLVTPDGHDVYCDSIFYTHPFTPWQTALTGYSSIANIPVVHENYRCLTWPITVGKKVAYALQVAASMQDVNADLNRLFVLFLIIIPIALLCTGITAYIISREAFKPIAQMTRTAKEISVQNLQRRIPLPKAKDEIYQLAETLNNMIRRIDVAIKSQRQFVASASHELRTPLTIIQTELELAEKQVNAHPFAKNIRIALSELDQLNHLTQSLLLLSQLDSVTFQLHKQSLRLDELLIDCVRIMQTAAKHKNLSLNLYITEAVEVSADKEKIKSVCLNLIDNAIKYSHVNGSVAISLEKVRDACISILFKDSGPGILPEDLPFIFKRFYRSPEIQATVSGSGLGLAIVDEVLLLHNGRVSVESKPGAGATFKIELPLT